MQIEMLPIDSIKPDPNQPRKTFDTVRISEMAKSILTEGVINPVEIDEKNIIITGEMRWRSAKKAGLTEIPCKILTLNKNVRFRRQVIENIHHNTMTAWETAVALQKLLGLRTSSEVEQGKDAGISKLAREMGKSETYIRQLLSILEEEGETKKYLQTPESKYSYIRDINLSAPEEYKEELKKKVTDGKIQDRATLREMARALKEYPEKAREIIDADYSGESASNLGFIHTIAPRKDVVKSGNYGSDLILTMNHLSNLLKKYGSSELLMIDRVRVEKIAEQLVLELSTIGKTKALEGELVE